MPIDHTRTAGREDPGGVHVPDSKHAAEEPSIVVAQPARRSSEFAGLMASSIRFVRGLLSSRRGLVLASAVVVAGGLALGWEWLAVAGVLPLVLSVLPCVAMCALGLCMMKGGDGKSCSTPKDSGGMVEAKLPADRL